MFRAAWKSLLGAQGAPAAEHVRDRARRRVRLRLAGLHRHAQPELHRDHRARASATSWCAPRAAPTADGLPSSLTIPAGMVADLEPVDGAARVGRQRAAPTASSWSSGRQGDRRQRAPGFGINWTDAPAGHGIEGLSIVERHRPRTDRDEVALDVRTAEKAGYDVGDQVDGRHLRHATRLIEADPGRHRRSSPTAARSTARRSPSSTPRPRRSSSSTGEDVYTDLWVDAEDGVSQEELRDAVAAELPDGRRGGHRRRRRRREQRDSLQDDLGFLTTFLLDLRRHRAGGRRLPDRQHLLDPGRPAQPRARPAARAGCLATAGHPVGAAGGVRRRRGRLDHRPRRSACCSRSAIKALFASIGLDLAGQSLVLVAAHGPRGVRRGRGRHHGGGLAARSAYRPDRARAGAAGRRRAAGVLDPPPAGASASR